MMTTNTDNNNTELNEYEFLLLPGTIIVDVMPKKWEYCSVKIGHIEMVISQLLLPWYSSRIVMSHFTIYYPKSIQSLTPYLNVMTAHKKPKTIPTSSPQTAYETTTRALSTSPTQRNVYNTQDLINSCNAQTLMTIYPNNQPQCHENAIKTTNQDFAFSKSHQQPSIIYSPFTPPPITKHKHSISESSPQHISSQVSSSSSTPTKISPDSKYDHRDKVLCVSPKKIITYHKKPPFHRQLTPFHFHYKYSPHHHNIGHCVVHNEDLKPQQNQHQQEHQQQQHQEPHENKLHWFSCFRFCC